MNNRKIQKPYNSDMDVCKDEAMHKRDDFTVGCATGYKLHLDNSTVYGVYIESTADGSDGMASFWKYMNENERCHSFEQTYIPKDFFIDPSYKIYEHAEGKVLSNQPVEFYTSNEVNCVKHAANAAIAGQDAAVANDNFMAGIGFAALVGAGALVVGSGYAYRKVRDKLQASADSEGPNEKTRLVVNSGKEEVKEKSNRSCFGFGLFSYFSKVQDSSQNSKVFKV